MKEIQQELLAAHRLARRLKGDKTRPMYHFRVPFDLGFPADPNAMFYAHGRYHLMFVYESREDSYRWGHASSGDLLHWTFHPDALIPDETDGGIYSGGVFLDEKQRATIVYWALGKNGSAGGIRLADSEGPLYEIWNKREGYAVACTEHGVSKAEGKEIGCADPSNLFLSSGKYCMQLGNLCLLDKYRGDMSHPEFQGDYSELFVSDDGKTWTYDGRFYDRPQGGTELSEDCMCPYFAELPTKDGKGSGVYLELFISHNRGCQYYLGDFDAQNRRFLPKRHGRLTVTDNALFAPEAVKCPDGRLVMVAWMRDNLDDDLERELEKGWSGLYCLPRELYLGEDGDLCCLPLREIERERCEKFEFALHGERELGISLHSELCFSAKRGKVGVKVVSKDGFIVCCLDIDRGELVFDARNMGRGRTVKEVIPVRATDLRIFLDGCIADLFAGGKAISRQFFLDGARIVAFSDEETTVCAYEIVSTNII